MLRVALLPALLVFALPAAVSAQERGAQSADTAKEKRICKKTVETGSLVKGKKVCMTSREWRRTAEQGQALGREMQALVSTETGG